MDPQPTPNPDPQPTPEPAPITPAPVITPAPASAEPAAATLATAELEKVRELVIKANPEVVPDLVKGTSIDEILASVEPAHSAYQRIADQVRSASPAAAAPTPEQPATPAPQTPTPAPAQPPTVPAGGANNVVDPANLPPTAKIAQGLKQQRQP